MARQESPLSLVNIDQQLHADELANTHSDIASWQASLQAACFSSISEADVREIVAKQVEKAKEGDANALKFVFSQVIGNQRPVKINQTLVISDVETAARMAKRA
jgi:hypothetical protein